MRKRRRRKYFVDAIGSLLGEKYETRLGIYAYSKLHALRAVKDAGYSPIRIRAGELENKPNPGMGGFPVGYARRQALHMTAVRIGEYRGKTTRHARKSSLGAAISFAADAGITGYSLLGNWDETADRLLREVRIQQEAAAR